MRISPLLRIAGFLCLLICLWIICLWIPVAAAAPSSNTPIEVAATTTDLQSLVHAIGKERVHVTSIMPPSQDPHGFEPRPSDRQRLKTAQMVVRIGLDHDLWLDRLLRESQNPGIQKLQSGYVDASSGIPILEAKSMALAPADGHAHGAGNPHYWLDPLNAEAMSGVIEEALIRLDPDRAAFYAGNRDAFLETLHAKMSEWAAQLSPWQGAPVVFYHNSFPYLARRWRLKTVGFVEPKPGVPPSPAHLSQLVKHMRSEHVAIAVRELYEPMEIPRYLERTTGARIVTLVTSVAAIPEVSDYFALFDYNIAQLTQALSKS